MRMTLKEQKAIEELNTINRISNGGIIHSSFFALIAKKYKVNEEIIMELFSGLHEEKTITQRLYMHYKDDLKSLRYLYLNEKNTNLIIFLDEKRQIRMRANFSKNTIDFGTFKITKFQGQNSVRISDKNFKYDDLNFLNRELLTELEEREMYKND